MVYLDCPYCKENTEHYITHLSATGEIQVRCTECLWYRDGYVAWDEKAHKEVVKGDAEEK